MSTAKPTQMLPMSFFLVDFAIMMRMIPTRATKGEKEVGLSMLMKKPSPSTPARDRIQAVRVVPMLEPMMTPTVWGSCMMPEFTRPTSITVSAEEDWMAMVMPAPSPRLFHLEEVICLRARSSLPPASFSSPLDMTVMPYRKKASPPRSVNTEKMFIRTLACAPCAAAPFRFQA